MEIQFPFRKLLKIFDQDDFPGDDDPGRPEKAAWDYSKEAREGLMTTGLIEFFGIAVRKIKKARNTWGVFLESWDHITGVINIGSRFDRLSQTRAIRRSNEDKK